MDGDGIGSFNSTITGLLPNQTYYVRAYATNETGTAYGDNVKFTTSAFTSFQFNGKTIFIHSADTITSAWGNPGVVTGATSRSNGSDNTAYIVAQGGSPAAKKCADLVAGGYSDWYLPSRDELNAMFLVKNQVGGFNHPDYWSSTETGASTAVSQAFIGAGAPDTTASKSLVKACRCIRKD